MTGHESRETLRSRYFLSSLQKTVKRAKSVSSRTTTAEKLSFRAEHRFFLILRRFGISHQQFHLTNCTLPKTPISAFSQRSLKKCYDIDYGNCHKFTASTSPSRIFRCLSSRHAYKKAGDRNQAVAPEAQIREMRAGCCFDWENANER